MSTSAQEEGRPIDLSSGDSLAQMPTVEENHANREDPSPGDRQDSLSHETYLSNVSLAARRLSVPPALSGVLRDHYVTISRAIDATYSGLYALADSLFVEVSIAAPDHPVGPLMRAATLQAEMRDYEVLDQVSEFELLLDIAETRAHAWIGEHPDDAWGYCYLGHIYGYRAMWQGHFGSWMSAVRSGRKAKNAYHRAVDLDTLCGDAYLGLGSYHYWKSAKTEFINWTGIIKDQKDLGEQQTERAMEQGVFSREAAATGLLQIYLHQKRYDEAIALARKWHAVHPLGKTFLWGQAYAEFEAGRIDSAMARFDSLRARVTSDPMQGEYNLIEIDYHRALLYDRTGEVRRACEIMESMVHLSATKRVLDRQKDKLKKARKYLKKQCKLQ